MVVKFTGLLNSAGELARIKLICATLSRSGAIGPTEKVTFSHEYTHALQDQNFNLKGLALDEIGQGDRALARLSLVEGDATLLMSYWATAHLSQAETFQMLGESLNPDATKILTDMPAVLRESLLFPYTSGLQFVQGLQIAGGWSTDDDLFRRVFPMDLRPQAHEIIRTWLFSSTTMALSRLLSGTTGVKR